MSKPTFDLTQLGGLSDLMRPAAPAVTATGDRPREIPLADITEDPEQPRKQFDGDTLEELAESIRRRGVKTPISVRPAPEPGKFIINHGARRFRGSKLAGKTTIPAWVDADYADEDQVIENIHRDALKPREIAEFIGRKLAAGHKQVDIAKALGKSKAYVSEFVTLLDLPEPIAEAFNAGRTEDVTLLYTLVLCHKKDPEATTAWLRSQEISRGNVQSLRAYIAKREETRKTQKPGRARARHPDPDQNALPAILRKPTIHVECEGSTGQLVFIRRPTREGYVWISVAGVEKECRAEKIRVVSVTEG